MDDKAGDDAKKCGEDETSSVGTYSRTPSVTKRLGVASFPCWWRGLLAKRTWGGATSRQLQTRALAAEGRSGVPRTVGSPRQEDSPRTCACVHLCSKPLPPGIFDRSGFRMRSPSGPGFARHFLCRANLELQEGENLFHWGALALWGLRRGDP